MVNAKDSVALGKPLRKYRVLIRELKTKNHKIEKMRSFMIYDFKGNSEIDKIKKKLMRLGE